MRAAGSSAKGGVLVEAAGVEPRVSIDNRQLTDSRFAMKSANAMFSGSTVQTLYKNLSEFPE